MYGGQALMKDDQYLRRTISKRQLFTFPNLFLPSQHLFGSISFRLVLSSIFIWHLPLQNRWPTELLRSVSAQSECPGWYFFLQLCSRIGFFFGWASTWDELYSLLQMGKCWSIMRRTILSVTTNLCQMIANIIYTTYAQISDVK